MHRRPFLLEGPGYQRTLPRRSVDFQTRMIQIFGDRLVGMGSETPRVLVLTRTDDAEADAVGLKLTARGIPYLRVDADALDTAALSVTEDPGFARVSVSARGRNTCAPRVVWFRHFDVSAIDASTDDPVLRSYVRTEWELSVRSLLSAEDLRWINRPDAERDLDRVSQLRLARRAGLLAPRTLVSNDPERIRAFVASCPQKAVVKVLGSHFVEVSPGLLHGIFPRVVDPLNVDGLLEAASVPSMFQEYIPHVCEVRATVVGSKVIAAEVSQAAPGDVFERPDDVLARPHVLPAELERGLREYMRLARLEYGAFDFLLTPDGRYYFLEVNFTGDWTWLEARDSSFDITGKVCDHIVKLAHRDETDTERGAALNSV